MSKGNQLAQELGINCAQALYSQWGNFYAPIKQYPCVLFDESGYIVVNSSDELESCGIKLGKRTNVPNLISTAPSCKVVPAWRTGSTEEFSAQDVSTYYEGAVETISVNRYERNRKARSECTAYYGCICQACGIDLSEKYGPVATNFIHVHHQTMISTLDKEYEVDPISDLIPLCPNCHAIAHLRKEPYSIQEIKGMIAAQGNK